MKYVSLGSECTGCGACVDACPAGAINMALNVKKYFSYPLVDENKCIECSKCIFACPVINVNESSDPIIAYAAYDKDTDSRLSSTSGGVFSLLAEEIIRTGGVVAGAVYDNNFKVVHMLAETEDDIKNFRGSKYVQSDTTGIYKVVKEKLSEGKEVLFSGTPCQIAALKANVGENDGLYTADIICHGVPSPEIFKRYISESFPDEKIISINHRDKSFGWSVMGHKVVTDKGEYLEIGLNNAYIRLFLQNMILRDSCFDCKFKNFNSGSDITLGDFWGIARIAPSMHDNKGCSAVVINTPRGNKLFEKIKDRIKCVALPVDSVVCSNAAFTSSVKKPELRDECLEAFDEMAVAEVSEKYTEKFSSAYILKLRLRGMFIRLYGKIRGS